MAKRKQKDRRVKRHERVRKNLSGTPEKPRLCVFLDRTRTFLARSSMMLTKSL